MYDDPNGRADKDQVNTLDFSFVLASSVHDMKNSLGMLLNSLEVMVQEAPPQNDAQKKYFSTLSYEASRINNELVQLLALYRMQHEKIMVQVDEHVVVDVIEDQLARNDMLFQTRNVQVDVVCDPELRWYFDCDLIGGIINNILVNCVRYSRQRMEVRVQVVDRMLCLAIADDGRGYPQAMLDAPLLENAGVSFSTGSTNLGLLFAHRVAALHHAHGRQGYIHLANEGPLGGGVLSLYLP
ncbi:sensor histidine kinase KdpD [Marinimicrobium sp. ABcell2]|uniref:sensor histidine kinase n=1 Tax=Marinimicrobium sp. ABcell2 TaxID=3069751 RepID=UPI0027B1B153|nr:HAMP domain-containing sensor histidine kinase [Marinimicrobium sp. ABcell2]MDQ2075568.1 HAMP domain-containing sensor histidine kinase [Marinimicrobium sp. ABcell2]